MVFIYYERGLFSSNHDLTEIHDEAILKELEYDFNKNYTIYRTETPLICGGIINKQPWQNYYERKLKMLRVNLFSLLSICQANGFADRDAIVRNIKTGVHKFLKNDRQQFIKNI